MSRLGLRLRVFLFFCLIALGGIAVLLAGLWLGHRQLGEPGAFSAFLTAGIVAGFGLLGLCTFVWRCFDEHVSKPVEQLAAQFRVRAEAGIAAEIDAQAAKYLGDLAPAASAVADRLDRAATATAETVAARTDRLERQRAQLLEILSDIPVAVIVVSQDHKVVLYDGQAAALMAQEAPLRLDSSVFDYLREGSIRAVLESMAADGVKRREVAVTARSGTPLAGHVRVFGGGRGYTLMLEPLSAGSERPPVYDFDLLTRARPTDPDETPLRDLCFVVFDSETTGLDPARDAVVQLGAVRVVGGRVIASERFEALVDPARPIPPVATRVHGITDAMVAGAPPLPEVCAQFHAFARDAVLVAHNAPFDLAFLHRETERGGPRFDNPVLDTVHLSAVVFGGTATHTLDAICARLQIEIPPDARHSAMGDAMATAQALVAMLPILEARGLRHFGELRTEIRKHARILKLAD